MWWIALVELFIVDILIWHDVWINSQRLKRVESQFDAEPPDDHADEKQPATPEKGDTPICNPSVDKILAEAMCDEFTSPEWRVKEIVEKALEVGGFDGLVAQGAAPCGCVLGDLFPCGLLPGSCVGGYTHKRDVGTDKEGFVWTMSELFRTNLILCRKAGTDDPWEIWVDEEGGWEGRGAPETVMAIRSEQHPEFEFRLATVAEVEPETDPDDHNPTPPKREWDWKGVDGPDEQRTAGAEDITDTTEEAEVE